ncbi:MAG: hypothetical protein Q4F99_00220 [bacterium]|nr:hypothetical protein [bacterium]
MESRFRSLPSPRGDAQVLAWVLCLCDAVVASKGEEGSYCDLSYENLRWDDRRQEPFLLNRTFQKPEISEVKALALLAQRWLTPKTASQAPWDALLLKALSEDPGVSYTSVSDFAYAIRLAFTPEGLRRRWIWFIVLSILAWIIFPLFAILWRYWH